MRTASTVNSDKRKCFWIPTILFSSTGFLALTAVPIYGVIHGYHWYQWLVFAVYGALCSFSVAAGNHRMWSHRSYEAHWSLRLLFALFTAAALQNTTLNWCAAHRHHHRHIDDNDRDPYSAKRGFWFSHIDWMMHDYPSGRLDYKNVNDLKRDKIVMWQFNHYVPITLAMNIGLPIALGALTGDIIGMFLLAGVLRVVVNHHTTFMINSLGHMWGKRPFRTDITARDNPFLNLFTFGEGYHNYHHTFQIDYRSGIRWYQYDPTKWMVKVLSWVGITRNLKKTATIQAYKAHLTTLFEEARQRLADSRYREFWQKWLAKEEQHLADVNSKWSNLQIRRNNKARQEPPPRWELKEIQTKIRELEYSLKMQSKRLKMVMNQFHLCPLTAT
ncbi:acyl-CoA desaturase [Microbulbifer sp. ANSA001]|uniref:acyl-CoA desaturase n=1 Tax=Microbulbifer sp. ANSA001 TaxID=3243358 RepID=UPI004041BD15